MFSRIKQITLVILIGFALWGVFSIYTRFSPTPAYTEHPTPAAILKQVQSLARLETTSYTIEKIIDVEASASQGVIQDFLFGDKLLLIATGEVVAGIDLGKLTADHVQITDVKTTITLPAPEIFTTKLNETDTRVYDRQTGLLTKPDRDLETEARTRAVHQIRAAACEGDVLKKANDSAVTQLTTLLTSAGVKNLEIQTTAVDQCE